MSERKLSFAMAINEAMHIAMETDPDVILPPCEPYDPAAFGEPL